MEHRLFISPKGLDTESKTLSNGEERGVRGMETDRQANRQTDRDSQT